MSFADIQSKGRILRPKAKWAVNTFVSWDGLEFPMKRQTILSKAGSGCYIKGTRYKWRLSLPWVAIKKMNLSKCIGKYYESGSTLYFTNRRDAEYFFMMSF